MGKVSMNPVSTDCSSLSMLFAIIALTKILESNTLPLWAIRIILLLNDLRYVMKSCKHSARVMDLTSFDLYRNCPATMVSLFAWEACLEIPFLGKTYLSKVCCCPAHCTANNWQISTLFRPAKERQQ